MDEQQAQTEAHNARSIVNEIAERISTAEHELDLALGLLDDLTVYLPKASA